MRRRRGLFFLLALLVLWAVSLGIWSYMTIRQEKQRRAERQEYTEIGERMHRLALAMLMYAQEHKDHYPPANRWEQAIEPYAIHLPATLPRDRDGHLRRIAMNRALSGRSLDDLPEPASTILLYESTLTTPNAADDQQSMPAGGTMRWIWIYYADGHGYSYDYGVRKDLIDRSNHALKSR